MILKNIVLDKNNKKGKAQQKVWESLLWTTLSQACHSGAVHAPLRPQSPHPQNNIALFPVSQDCRDDQRGLFLLQCILKVNFVEVELMSNKQTPPKLSSLTSLDRAFTCATVRIQNVFSTPKDSSFPFFMALPPLLFPCHPLRSPTCLLALRLACICQYFM